MKKDVEHIRKSIAERKKNKHLGQTVKKREQTSSMASYLQEEEKHGYIPFSQTDQPDSSNFQVASGLLFKTMLAGIIFFGTALMFRMDVGWMSKPKTFVESALTEEFQFAAVNDWYQDKFGAPLAFLPLNDKNDEKNNLQTVSTSVGTMALPVQGTISQPFQKNGKGILIQSNNQANVYSMDEGIVVFAGNLKDTNKTIEIQHPDGSYTIYGNLAEIAVNQYQTVTKEQVIGIIAPAAEERVTEVFFAIKKDNQFINPIQVIKVNDTP